MGYVPFSKTGAELFFQLFSCRYQQVSAIITTNLEFTEWTSVFGNKKITLHYLIDLLIVRTFFY
nr:ATP-binding protein [Bacillus sp. FJAT-47783]